jgi:hypothetical protein
MAREPKKVSAAAQRARDAIAANFEAAVSAAYPDKPKTAAYKLIAAATGVGFGTLQRIEKASHGSQIDTLADVAKHLGTTIYDLCAPPSTAVRRKAPFR